MRSAGGLYSDSAIVNQQRDWSEMWRWLENVGNGPVLVALLGEDRFQAVNGFDCGGLAVRALRALATHKGGRQQPPVYKARPQRE